MIKYIVHIICSFFVLSASAQMHRVEFIENKGQWQDQVQFKAKIPSGNLYIEQNELMYKLPEGILALKKIIYWIYTLLKFNL